LRDGLGLLRGGGLLGNIFGGLGLLRTSSLSLLRGGGLSFLALRGGGLGLLGNVIRGLGLLRASGLNLSRVAASVSKRQY